MDKKTGLAFAAFAAAPAAALALPAVQTVETPSFNCDAASGGGTINWGDGLAFAPLVGAGSEDKSEDKVIGSPLSCADGSFDETIKLVGDSVTIDLLELSGGTVDMKWSSTDKWVGLDKTSYFDLFAEPGLDVYNKMGGQGDLDFVGIKFDSVDNFLKLDAITYDPGFNGVSLQFDLEQLKVSAFDALAPGEVSVSLYSTPQVPVPEPATLGLLGTGLIGLAMRWRRKSTP